MAAIINQKLGMNRGRERGDKREKGYINLYTSHPHPLFFFIYLFD